MISSLSLVSRMKLNRLIKMCPSETYNTVRVVKHLSDMFSINTLRTGDADLRFNTVKLGTSASSP